MPMSLKNIESESVKLGLLGAAIGACAPVLYSLVQLAFFHPDMTMTEYYGFLLSPEELTGHVFIGGAVVVMGLAGAVVGRQREKDAAHHVKVETANRELAALNSIAEIISKTRDLDAIVYMVLKETLSLSFLKIERKGVIFIRDEADPEYLNMVANVDLAPHLVHEERRIKLGHCLCGKAAMTGEVMTSLDCFTDGDHTTQYPGMAKHGHIVVPITSKRGVLGVMTFYLPPDSVPSRDDVRLLSAIASQLAVAVENVKLMRDVSDTKEHLDKKGAELDRTVDALKALVEVDRIILSTVDKDEMLFRVGAQIRQLVDADMGGVAIMDNDSGGYVYTGGWGMDVKKGDTLLPEGWRMSDEFRSGRPVLASEISEGRMLSPIDRLLVEAGAKSNAYVPIIRKGRVAGLFFLGSIREAGISGVDVENAVTFASRMGIALEHARLIYSLEDMSVNIIHALVTAIDAKSSWTKGHSERVAEYSVDIASRMGMDRQVVERLRLAGFLHDIGKIGTYDMLLDKAGKLTEEEHDLIKQHPERGCEILSPIKELKDLLPAVKYHHERWDGNGYPAGLKGEEIPLSARIICVADSFDTMTADRPYRPSIGLENALQEFNYCSGTQFCPEVVDTFLEIAKERGPAITKHTERPMRLSGRLSDILPDLRA